MENIYICPFCERTFTSKNAWCSHKGKCKKNPLYVKHQKSEKWYLAVKEKNSKPKEKYKCFCKFCEREFEYTFAKSNHEKYCPQNLNRISGHKPVFSEESKKKLSESMKKAHEEGRAHKWTSRTKCKHSYPELWLISVLNRELGLKEGVDYCTELPFFGQFLDFAWADRKLAIEIDGKQHELEERRRLDERKDKNLLENGWKELRLKWSDVQKDKQKFIEIIKTFLEH